MAVAAVVSAGRLALLLLLSGCRPAPIGTDTDSGGVGILSGLQFPLDTAPAVAPPVPKLVSS